MINVCRSIESNLINCSQFLIMLTILQKKSIRDARKQLRNIFNSIDTDGNGYIDNEELRNAMRLLFNGNDEMKLSKEELDEMIAEFDVDADGRLTFDGKHRYTILFFRLLFVDRLEFAMIFAEQTEYS
jgi:Ca2+-binding EF-hand superfamily protein